jgi:two-component system, OmpR family, response regulator
MQNNQNMIKIFLVDDDVVFTKLLQMELSKHSKYEIETYETGELSMQQLWRKPNVIVLDFNLNGIDKNAMNGITTLNKIKGFDSKIPVIMLSSQEDIEVALECMHYKALDYVMKSETLYLRLPQIIETYINCSL